MPTFAPSAKLPPWRGFVGRHGVSDGTVEVMFHRDRVTARERAALASALSSKRMKPILIDAMVAAYPTLRPWDPRPKTCTAAQLPKRCALESITVMREHHEGVSYVAYGFSCKWDPSGAYVLTHGERVVAAGGSEILAYPLRDPARGGRKKKTATPKQREAARAAAKKRAAKNPRTLVAPPGDRDLTITLPDWAGASDDEGRVSKGVVTVGFGDEVEPTIGPAQRAAYRHLLAKARALRGVLLDALVEAYPKLVRGVWKELGLPQRIDRDGLVDAIALVSVHLHRAERDGLAYTGYQFSCRWDREHGLGVLTHGGRVVEIGHADVAFLAWIAARARRRRSA